MFTPNQDQIAKVYDAAKERFAAYGVDAEQAMEEFEKKIVRQAYEKYRTTVGVARALKISQPTAYRKIGKYIKDK